MEEDIILFLQSKSSSFLDILCFIYSYLISWIGAILVFIIIVFFVNRKFGLFFGFGFICTLIINYAIKVIINRPRPYETYPQIINKLQTIGKSFPSGHAVSCTFIVLTLLTLVYKISNRLKRGSIYIKVFSCLIGFIMIAFTAFTRMYLGQHYLTDIVAGILLSSFMFLLFYCIWNLKLKNLSNKSYK